MERLTTHELLRLSSRIRYRAVGDEGVLVHLDNGRVIVVNEVGLHIVKALAKPQTRAELVSGLVAGFDIDRERATADLERYLAELDHDQVLEHLASAGA